MAARAHPGQLTTGNRTARSTPATRRHWHNLPYKAVISQAHATSEGLRTLLDLFAGRLGSAQRAGTLRGGVDPATAALGLLALYQGVLVLIRAGWDKRQIEVLIDDAIGHLEEPGHDH